MNQRLGVHPKGLDGFAVLGGLRLVLEVVREFGKVGIFNAFLQKPGAWTAEEYEVTKTHTTMGAETKD